MHRVRFSDEWHPDYVEEFYDDKPDLDSANSVLAEPALTTTAIDAKLSAKGYITGTVTSDASGLGLGNISVSVSRVDDDYNSWVPVGWAYTDGSGQYETEGFIPGVYHVCFNDWSDRYEEQCYDGALDVDNADDVAVESGLKTRNINASMILRGRIMGTVTAEEDGSALHGIGVAVHQYHDSGGFWELIRGTSTGDQGKYEIAGLDAGKYRVHFNDGSLTYVSEYYNDVLDFELATDINLAVSETAANIDAELAKIAPPANDDIANAFDITAIPFDYTQTTIGATTAVDDPVPSCFHRQVPHTVWYRIVLLADETVIISTDGSDFDTVLTLWQGEPGSLTEIACNDDYQGLSSQLPYIQLTSGTPYYIEAASLSEYDVGHLELTVTSAWGTMLLSPHYEHNVDGINYARGDILSVDENGDWGMVFDASDLGIPKAADLHAFTFQHDNAILLVFDRAVLLPGLNQRAKPWDIVRFDIDQLGEHTRGTFSLFFDGSEVGLSSSGEKIDALQFLNGRLYLSTVGRAAVTNWSGKLRVADEDILEFDQWTYGDNTTGEWRLAFDGSTVPGLAREDIASLMAVSLDESDFSISSCTTSAFMIAGVPGNQKDILHLFSCESGICADIVWHGPDHGFKKNIDGLGLETLP